MPHSFQSAFVKESGMSTFRIMALTVMIFFFKTIKPRIINYRWYNDFSNEDYRKIMTNDLKNFVIRALNF